MRNRPSPAAVAGLLGIIAGAFATPAPALAADITVLGGMGVVSGLRDLAPAYEQLTGHHVTVTFLQAAALTAAVNSGAPADIAAIGPEQVDAFVQQGKMVAGTRTNFAQAGVGVAVKTGAARPDISTPEAFRNAMLNAKSIGYSRGGSGQIAAKVMEKLGIADQLKARTTFIDGAPVAERVAKGDVEVGLQQINVIIPVAGADYIGPLPNELQQTVRFAGAILTVSKDKNLARAFLNYIASADAGPLLRRSGMEPWH